MHNLIIQFLNWHFPCDIQLSLTFYVLGMHVESSTMMSSSSLVDTTHGQLSANMMKMVGSKICQNFKLAEVTMDVDIFSVK